ncbi:hypothetical protein GCM10007855_26680 [Aliivibrio sifiae]|uniref:Uncharacterized protein n=1 Tax=Aliivibrio sifiae TaxID=566293 RepID=A0ABQ6APF6_9GAMM|nr:hypothetical protein GCM10007855_26680 [Aliivibrio sifiae]
MPSKSKRRNLSIEKTVIDRLKENSDFKRYFTRCFFVSIKYKPRYSLISR